MNDNHMRTTETLELPPTIVWPLRAKFKNLRRLLRDLRHRRRQRAAVGAVDGETVLRRANHGLSGSFVYDVFVKDRLEHVRMIFIRYHVYLRVDVERLDGAAQVRDFLVSASLRKTAAFDNRRIVLSFRNVIHHQAFNPLPLRYQEHPCINYMPH